MHAATTTRPDRPANRHRAAACGSSSWLLLTAVVLLLVGCIACSADAPPARDEPADTESTTAVPSKETLDQLRALGYVDFGAEKADPAVAGVVVYDPERSYPGYNLYTVRPFYRADLVDADGNLVHSWEGVGDRHWSRSVLLPDGDLLVVGPRKFVERLSWDGEVRWRHEFPAHHDVAVTPHGRFIALRDRRRLIPDIDPELRVRDNQIVAISADGQIVEQLSLLRVLRSGDDLFRLEPVASRRSAIDILHSNSLRWIDLPNLEGEHEIYAPGNVLVSIRHQDSIAVINWESRELVWAWGRGEIIGPHDATPLENGNILLFDNGLGRGWSRVIELDPRTERIVWEYRAPESFYTASHGAAQRLPNGNTLITESTKGHAFEVTPDGEIVWEYYSPHLNEREHRATITRLYRYDADLIERLLEAH